MKVKYKKGFPIPKGYSGITLWPFGIYIRYEYTTEKLVNHEKIHWKQQQELLGISFYILYGIFYLINLFRYQFVSQAAYYNNPFEKESYNNEDNEKYLSTRPKFKWFQYFLYEYRFKK